MRRPTPVGAWAYRDHGPNHTLNSFRGLFGGIVIRELRRPRPDVERRADPAQLPAAGERHPWRLLHCINGRTFAGNTPTIRARVGQRVAIHVIGMDSNFHTFHVHGHRWRDSGGAFVDCPTLGPNETIRARSSWRTIRDGGCTTATSSPTRTPAWPVGTWREP